MQRIKLIFILYFGLNKFVDAQNSSCFPDTTVYCQGITAISMAVANFNGDAFKDIVAINQNGGYSILLNNGDGTFSTTDYAGSMSQSYVSAGDVDGDNKQDFVVAAGTTIDLYKGNGDGTFIKESGIVTLATPANAIELSDMAINYRQDLIVLEPVLQQVEYFMNDGSGVFYSYGTYSVGSNPVSLITGKFHASTDNLKDIVVANAGDNTLTVLYNQPGMIFGSDTTFTTDVSPYFLSKGYYNNSDIQLDISIASYLGNNVCILLADGFDGFLPYTSYPVGSNPTEIATGNFNNDPFPDIVSVSLASNTISVLLGNSNGTFEPDTTYSVNGNGICIRTADFDNDFSSDDIVVGHFGAAGVTVLTNHIPIPIISYPPLPVCANDMIMFSSTGPYSFNWSGGISSGVWFAAPDSGSFSYQLMTLDTTTGCSLVDSFSYVVDQCLGLQNNYTAPNVQIKPTPSIEYLEVSELFLGDMVTIFDLSGRIIYEFRAENEFMRIDTRDFPEGIYQMKCIHNDVQRNARLLIAK